MFLSVPFTYRAEVLMPRCRNAEPKTFGERIEVEIQDVSGSEAPVAVRWAHTFEGRVRNPETPIIRETRWFDGNHFRPVFDAEYGFETKSVSRSTLIEACAAGTQLGNALPFSFEDDLKKVISGEMKSIGETQIRKIITSERDKVANNVTKRAADMLLIDGEVWRKCHEPIYYIHQGIGILVSLREADGMRQSPERQFRIDRLDDAMEHFNLDGRWLLERADLLVPDSVRFDDEVPAMLSFSSRVVDRFRDASLHNKSTGFLLTWGRLRDAVEAAQADPTPDNMSELTSRLTDLHTKGEEVSYQSNDIKAALDRWSLRPLNASDDISDYSAPAP
jgi:hypothetical protein